jgi:diaminopimelate dehydrogenase
LKLDSNPEFTSSVLLAYARGIYRARQHGATGAFSVFDIPFAWLSPKSGAELRKALL